MKATLGWPFSFALNRLLDAEPWARERLAPFAGEVLELRAAPLPTLRFLVLPGGRLEAGGEGAPALVITLRPRDLVARLQGEEQFLRSVQVDGEPRLAAAVMALARHLRWDFEEDLSRIVGDVAAHRLAGVARELAAWPREAVRRLAESAADYAVEERRVLLGGGVMAAFAHEVAALRDALERLEKRIERLG
jgi:ubiquinone biosynthesis protein UbiJ